MAAVTELDPLTDRKKQTSPKSIITLLIQVSNEGPSVVKNKSEMGKTERQKGGWKSLSDTLVHRAILHDQTRSGETGTVVQL